WFDPSILNGNKTQMTTLFNNVDYQIEFFPDAQEPNQTSAEAKPITINAAPTHLTFFYDPENDGKGATDTDWMYFDNVSGALITIETTSLIDNANTSISLIDSNGHTVLASNDDRAQGDPSSLIEFTTTHAGRYYVKVANVATTGAYGSYDLRVW